MTPEDDLQKSDNNSREYGLARRGLYLTVHVLNKVKEVLKWELTKDRERAHEAAMGDPSEKIRPQS
jgi:hypothetical protein